MAVKVNDHIERKIEPRKFSFYLPWDDKEVAEMMIRRGHKRVLNENHEYDVALFTGGADVCPMLYGEKALDTTRMNIYRDLREIQFFKSLHPMKYKVGIGRGAQLLNVLSGGRLWQDVNNHNDQFGHQIDIFDRHDNITVSSRHHQMMIPPIGSNVWVMANASESTKKQNQTDGLVEYTKEQLSKSWDDPEILYLEDTHSFCFQPNPEDIGFPQCRDLFFEFLEWHWSDEKNEKASREVR